MTAVNSVSVLHCAGAFLVAGLLRACIKDPNPCLFFEPKVLYRSAVEQVPIADYTLPLGQAEVVRPGTMNSEYSPS